MLSGLRSARTVFFTVAAFAVAAQTLLGQVTQRVSVSSNEVQDATGASNSAYVTPDGRFVVFASSANNLVANDNNTTSDIFVRDRLLGTTARVSVPDPGVSGSPTEANRGCILGRAGVRYCSDDGRHVVFESAANNLVNNDTNGDPPWHIDGDDIFVRDRDVDGNGVFDEPGVGKTRTRRVSVKTSGAQYTEFVVGLDTYGGGCHNPSISANGRSIAFECEADSLTTGNEQGTTGSNIYYHDRDNDNNGIYDQTGDICIIIFENGCITAKGSVTELVSKVRCCSGGQFDGFSEDPAISGSGRYVAFVTASQYLDYDLVFDNDSNNRADVYVRDMWQTSEKMQRVSVDSNENQNTDSGSGSPSISEDGRYVAFTTGSSQLLPNGVDTNATSDVYLRDRGAPVGGDFIFTQGSTQRVSLGVFFPLLGQSNRFVQLDTASSQPFVSPTGRYVAFVTTDPAACGIICPDNNGVRDVYVRDVQVGSEMTYFASIKESDSDMSANGVSEFPSVSEDGSVVAFTSVASDMVTPDSNGANADAYVRVIDGAPRIVSAVSRKTHGMAGDFDIDLPLTGDTGIECRSGGVTQLVVTFDKPVEYHGGVSFSHLNIGVGNYFVSGNSVIINCTNAPDAGCSWMQFGNWTDASGNPITGQKRITFRNLVGDVNGDGIVASADITQIKARSGSDTNGTNFRYDVTADGIIASADITQVKARSGNTASCN